MTAAATVNTKGLVGRIIGDGRYDLRTGMPVIWQSSLGPARAVDTLLVRKADSKVVTQTGEWPPVSMTIHGARFYGQAVLQRAT